MDQKSTKSSNTILIPIIVLVVLVIGVGVLFYFTQAEEEGNVNVVKNVNKAVNTNAVSNTNTKIDGSSFLSEGFLFFEKPVYQNKTHIAQLNHMSAAGKINSITQLELPYSTNIASFNDGKIYYITKSNLSEVFNSIGIYNITDGQEKILLSNDTDGQINKLFIVDRIYIFYLQGPCISGGQEEWEQSQCDLYRYDLINNQNELFIEDIYSQLDSIYLAVLDFISYDAENSILQLVFSGGDAGVGSMSIYELDLETKKITKTKSTNFSECGVPCPADQTSDNEAYYKLRNEVFARQPCGEFTFGNLGTYLVYKGSLKVEEAESWQVINCFESTTDTSDWQEQSINILGQNLMFQLPSSWNYNTQETTGAAESRWYHVYSDYNEESGIRQNVSFAYYYNDDPSLVDWAVKKQVEINERTYIKDSILSTLINSHGVELMHIDTVSKEYSSWVYDSYYFEFNNIVYEIALGVSDSPTVEILEIQEKIINSIYPEN